MAFPSLVESAIGLADSPITKVNAASGLLGLLENLPPDQHAADFARSSADLVELGVAQQAAGREVIDVAVAAKTLDRFQRHPGRALGGVQNGAGGIFTRGAADVAGTRDGVNVGLRGIHGD